MSNTHNHNSHIYGVRYLPENYKKAPKGNNELSSSSYLSHYIFLNCYFRDKEEAQNVANIFNVNYDNREYKIFKTTEQRLNHIVGNPESKYALIKDYTNARELFNYKIYESSDEYIATLNNEPEHEL